MARGGYTIEQVKKMDTLELSYVHYYQELSEQKMIERLGSMLGVIWYPDLMAEADAKAGSAPSTDEMGRPLDNKVYIPLALSINPEILDIVTKKKKGGKSSSNNYIGGGEYVPKAGEEVHSFKELDHKQFKDMFGGILGLRGKKGEADGSHNETDPARRRGR